MEQGEGVKFKKLITGRGLAKEILKTYKPMFQYNCVDGSLAGGGGEYEVQMGFGWTNGMLLDIVRNMDCF